MIQGDCLMPFMLVRGLLYGCRSHESTRMLPKPSTAATTQALCKAVCHLSRANTLSTRITNPNTSSDTVTPSSGEEAKNKYTQPSRNTFSYQCAISMSASARPENSVVIPRTSSWWAWCEEERSNGDLRNLISSV